jgi:hypothetical protein
VPYDLEAPETDPDATRPWAFEEAEDDTDTTARYAFEEEEDAATPPEDPAGAEPGAEGGEDPDHHTVELEALPGGNTDEQAGERDSNRD